MIDTDKGSAAYKKMKRRYVELKVILTTSGINITELDETVKNLVSMNKNFS